MVIEDRKESPTKQKTSSTDQPIWNILGKLLTAGFSFPIDPLYSSLPHYAFPFASDGPGLPCKSHPSFLPNRPEPALRPSHGSMAEWEEAVSFREGWFFWGGRFRPRRNEEESPAALMRRSAVLPLGDTPTGPTVPPQRCLR